MGSRRSSTVFVSGDGDKRGLNFLRGGAVVARRSHNPEVVGAIPTRATIIIASGPVPISPPSVAALASGGRRVRAGRRAPFVSGPLSVARENLALTNRRQPASDAVRKGPKRLPCLVALHPQRMEQAHGKLRVEDSSKFSGASRE